MTPPGGDIDLEALSINKPLPLPLPAGTPVVTSEGVVYTDITDDFFRACQALEPGDVVKGCGFTLFDAVGSLEIGDPKMDSGLLAPGETLHDDYDVTRPLLASEVIGIIDQLLCLEMAWHLGYPLSQTLFTSIYIEAMLNPTPESLDDASFTRDRAKDSKDPMVAVLRAYCLGLVKSCSYVNEIIKHEFYYEEEDFVTNTFSLSLLDSLDLYEIRDELMAARAIVHNLRHNISSDMALALGFRLELRTAFLRALELSELRCNPDSQSLPWTQMKAIWEPIAKSHALGTPVPEAFSTKIQRRLISTVPPRPIVQLKFEEAYEHFKNLFLDGLELLDVLHFTDAQSLLTFVMSFQAKKPQPLVFIRTLLQNFLFRDMRVLSNLSIRTLLDDDFSIVVLPASPLIDPAHDLVEATHDPRHAVAFQMECFRQRVAQTYLDMFRTFCQNRCRVRRTLCHAIQGWENVQIDAEEVDQLIQFQVNFDSLSAIPPGHQATAASHVPGPLSKTSTLVSPLSSWAYLYKLRMMGWIVQLGFELETYQNDELAGMYWYLNWLAKTRAGHIRRIYHSTLAECNVRRSSTWKVNHAVASNTTGVGGAFPSSATLVRSTSIDDERSGNSSSSSNNSTNNTTTRGEAIAASSSSSTSSLNPAYSWPQHPSSSWPQRWRPPLTPGDEATLSRSLEFLAQAAGEASVTQDLADALSSLYTALRRLGLVTAPPRPFGTEDLRFDVRMKPFAAIGLPEQPDHARFAAATLQATAPTVRLLDSAERALACAGRSCEVLARLVAGGQGAGGSGGSAGMGNNNNNNNNNNDNNRPAGTGNLPPPGCHAGEGRVLVRWLDGVKRMRDAVTAAEVAVRDVRRALEGVEGWEDIVDAEIAEGVAEGEDNNQVAPEPGERAAVNTDDRQTERKGKGVEGRDMDVDVDVDDQAENKATDDEKANTDVQTEEEEQQRRQQQHQRHPKTGKLDPDVFGIKVEIPRPDEGHHEWWIVPRIVETKRRK